MFLTRGFTFTHEAVREWEERFAPLLTERLRAKRRGKSGKKWHADELRHEVACLAVEVPKGGLKPGVLSPVPYRSVRLEQSGGAIAFGTM